MLLPRFAIGLVGVFTLTAGPAAAWNPSNATAPLLAAIGGYEE